MSDNPAGVEPDHIPVPDPAPDPEKTNKRDIEKAARAAGVDPTGLTKAEVADQIETVRLTGRPPLAQVAAEAVTALDKVTTVVVPDGDQIAEERALADIPNDHPAVTGQED